MVVLAGYVLGLIVGCAAAALSYPQGPAQLFAHTMLRYFLPVGVGLTLLFASIGHVFKSRIAARRLGWPADNPFQKELGFWDGAAGVVSLMCFWASTDFWLAAVVFNAIFWTLAAVNHAWEVVHNRNYAFDNVSTAVVDFLVPVTLIVLYAVGGR